MNLVDTDLADFDAICAGFQWRVPEHYNIAEQICHQHADRPERRERVALYYENARGDRQSFTFGEMRTLSDRCANALRAQGIGRGDRVGIVLGQRPETAIAHLAIYKLGAVALPLSVLFGPEALEYRLRDSEAKLLITDDDHLPVIEQLQPELPHLQTVTTCSPRTGKTGFWQLLERATDTFETVRKAADDPVLLIYTSGTTGPPKGALIAHRSLLGNLPGFELSQNFYPQPGDLFWTPADWAWTGGLLDGLVPAWYYGTPMLAYEGGKFDPERICNLLGRYGVTNGFVPPTALKMMRQVSGIRARHKVRFRAIMSAGETLGGELVQWGEEQLGVRINEMWGQTEFNYIVGNCSRIMPVKPGSMGKPYPGHEVAPIDEGGEIVPVGEHAELAARAGDPVMFLGYWKKAAATREKFINGWFRTGDIGYRDEDGYLWFVGRCDDVISSAGYRIGPGEIEDCLLKHPAVLQAAVIGSPDELRGSIVKAYIVLAAGHAPSDTLKEDIQQSVRTRLAAYEYPRAVEFIDQLPMTVTGKVRRMELRTLDEAS